MLKIVTEQPLWYVVFCVLLGAAFSFLLYRKDKMLLETNPWLKRIVFSLRFLFITLLSFLLLSPLLKTLSRQTQKPIIVVAQDNSESIVVNKDSSFYRKEYAAKMNALIEQLKGKYDVEALSFGDKVRDNIAYSYSDKQTDYSNLLSEVSTRFSNRNVGALIVASDGLYNRGSNPVFLTGNFKVPVYTVALGDTAAQKDLRIGNLRFNKVVFLNNTFPVEVAVEARQCSGANTILTLAEDSATLFTKPISISGNKFNTSVPVYLDAKKKGMHHYRISLSAISGEITTANNVKDVYIEVQESKQKILILADSPHPDIAALKLSIESNENYEVKVQLADHFAGKLTDYQLIIMHQLPSKDHSVPEIISELKRQQIPAWYILGSQTDVNAFNTFSVGVSIQGGLGKTNDVQAEINNTFSLFTISEEVHSATRTFPPLLTPFGEYKPTTTGSSLLVQKIGSVITGQPLLFLADNAQGKAGVLCGEGIWRWRLNDYQLNNNFNAFNEIVTKTVQYLSTREQKSHFKITAKNMFDENEPVMLDAEVYNDNYELINTPDISIAITNKEGKTFPFAFSKTEKAYTLNAGFLSPGNYRYKATVKIGDKPYMEEGQFSISALQAELSETVADHQLLYAWAHKTGGELFYPARLDSLSKLLLSRDDLKTISYSETKLLDLVNLKWFFFLLLAFISLEWFLRKRNGMY